MINLNSIRNRGLLNWNTLFLFLIFLLLLPDHLINLPPLGVDSSWQIAINLAFRDGLVFGKDIIFTYGPLGFLSTNLGLEIPYGNLWILLFNISIICILLFIVNQILKEYNSLVVYGIIFIASFNLAYAEISYRNAIIIIFFLFQNIKKFNFYSFSLVFILLVIQFFIKPSVAIYFIVISLVTSLYIAFFKRNKLIMLCFLGAVLLIFIISKLLRVDLSGYILSTFELSGMYNEAMNRMNFSFLKAAFTLLFALSFLLTFIIISLITILKNRKIDEILISGIAMLTFYFLFKQSYVRCDSIHLLAFWSTVLSVVFVYFYKTNHTTVKYLKFLYCFILIITISAWSFVSKFKESRYPIQLPVGYLNEFFYQGLKNDYIKSSSKLTKLPESIRSMVGNNSIDVMPYDINSIYFNGLNYKPRPVIQSYVAVSTALNTYNFNFLKGNNKPEFILYSNGSTDDRYPFWDESMTKQVLISNYETNDSLFVWKENKDTSFLLKRRINPLLYNEMLLSDTLFELNKKYYLPKTSNIIYLSAEIEYSKRGRLQNILYKPPFIYINLYFENGGIGTYRLVLPEIQHGVIINKKLIMQTDAYLLFKYQGRRNENITSFVILSGNKAYKSRFRIRLSEYSYI